MNYVASFGTPISRVKTDALMPGLERYAAVDRSLVLSSLGSMRPDKQATRLKSFLAQTSAGLARTAPGYFSRADFRRSGAELASAGPCAQDGFLHNAEFVSFQGPLFQADGASLLTLWNPYWNRVFSQLQIHHRFGNFDDLTRHY